MNEDERYNLPIEVFSGFKSIGEHMVVVLRRGCKCELIGRLIVEYFLPVTI